MAIQINGTSGISGVDGSAATPALQGSDTNTGISFGTDEVNINTGGSTRATVDSSGRLLVGTSTSRAVGSGGQASIQTETTTGNVASFINNFAGNAGAVLSLGHSRTTSIGSNTLLNNGDQLGEIRFAGADGTDIQSFGASIAANVDDTPGGNDMPGRLVFATTADGASSPTERMRIDSEGVVRCGNDLTRAKRDANSIGMKIATAFPQTPLEIETATGGTRYNIRFWQGSTEQGRIETGSGSTNYVTSSDYRLKENIVPVTDGIQRLQQLNPSRFNFIAHPSRTVDGFLAHEVQDVVPEAISGEKDAVEVWQENEELPDGVSIGDNKLDEDGNTIPVYQGIDQSKLVPLLTAALQEAIAKIETLETRLTALEGGTN